MTDDASFDEALVIEAEDAIPAVVDVVCTVDESLRDIPSAALHVANVFCFCEFN